MPWRAFLSPVEQWSQLPSFLVGEWVFIGLALALLWHALRSGRVHVLYWVGALLAGTANDLVFMALPLVDNFWHGQATIMLTARLPLYIPCVYVCFMYLPAMAVRRLGLPLLSTAALTGLVALLFYAPFDITGAKHLWWTWHDTDIPIADRILGAPASSSLWVLTFAGSYALILAWLTPRDPEVEAKGFARALGAVAVTSTVLMVLQMTALQQLDGGAPGYAALGTGIALYASVALYGVRKAEPLEPSPSDRVPLVGVVVYYLALVLCMALSDPTSHVSTGVHQEVGECYVEAQDITGLTRYEFLCAADYEEDFTFACVDEPPTEGASWYTVCGRAHTSFMTWMTAVALLGLFGSVAFAFLFGVLGRRRS